MDSTNYNYYQDQSIDAVAQLSISIYDEVQQGVIFKTVDDHEEQLTSRNEEIKILKNLSDVDDFTLF